MTASWQNIAQMLRTHARTRPDAVCVRGGGRTFTFSQTDARVNRLSRAVIAMGLKKGDRFALMMDNCVELFESYLMAARTGVVAVPVNFRLDALSIARILERSGARAAIVSEEWAPMVDGLRGELPALRRLVSVGQSFHDGWMNYDCMISAKSDAEPAGGSGPDDPWLVMYTSGTTGEPKGVVRTHESHAAFHLIAASEFGLTRDDVCLTVMPLCHINSVFFAFTFTHLGAAVSLMESRNFTPDGFLEAVERDRATFASLVPTHYATVASEPAQRLARHDASSLRRLLCSSAPANVELKRAIMRIFPGVALYEAYGSTEAGIVTVLGPAEQLDHPGSCGREVAGTPPARILGERGAELPDGEIGEIFSSGPMLFAGYSGRGKITRPKRGMRGAYFSAGDMGFRDRDGHIHIVDRKDDLIITGGEHVYPSEVERVLRAHPAVHDAAVVGLPDPKWGERVTAAVVLNHGADAAEQDIKNHCQAHLPPFKRPKKIEFIRSDEMPRTPNGKVMRRALRAALSGGK